MASAANIFSGENTMDLEAGFTAALFGTAVAGRFVARTENEDVGMSDHDPENGSTGDSRPLNITQSLAKFAGILKLTKERRAIVQKLIEQTEPEEQFLASISFMAYVGQEVVTSSKHSSRWRAPKVIHDRFKDYTLEKLVDPDTAAVSVTKTPDGDPIPNSLGLRLVGFSESQTEEYIEEHYPSDYRDEDCALAVDAVLKFLKRVMKDMRSKARLTLLKGVPMTPEAKIIKIPSSQKIVVHVARATMGEKTKDITLKNMLQILTPDEIIRIIVMRYLTAHAYMHPDSNKRFSQWSLMDKIFHDVREENKTNPDYGKNYYHRIYTNDQTWFNGQRTWAEIQALTDLPLPTRHEVLSGMGVTVDPANENVAGNQSGWQEDQA